MIASSQEHRNVTSKLLPEFNAHIHNHPLAPQFFSGCVFKTTDYASRSQFKATAMYNEYYRHLDVETQIGFSIPVSQENVSILALSRKVPDFSERDRLILMLLKPHLINALRNATELGGMRLEKDLLQKGAEAERQGAVLFQSDGVVLCITPFAREMLKQYFDAALDEGGRLPERIVQWFKAGGFAPSVERQPLTVEREDRCLKIRLLNDFTTGDYILIIAELDPSLALQNLQGFGLSCRETEVLTWLAKGKTNEEIALILGMSRRTAEKHLENIFAKLGVETRAAAAAIMSN